MVWQAFLMERARLMSTSHDSMINSPETWEKRYEYHKDILGTVGGIWKCTSYTVRKLLFIFRTVIIVLKLCRKYLSSRGRHADVFRSEVIFVSYLFSDGSAKSICMEWEKKIKYGQMLIVESRLSVYEYSSYSFFDFLILYKTKLN